jgi:hypothetical protein
MMVSWTGHVVDMAEIRKCIKFCCKAWKLGKDEKKMTG